MRKGKYNPKMTTAAKPRPVKNKSIKQKGRSFATRSFARKGK